MAGNLVLKTVILILSLLVVNQFIITQATPPSKYAGEEQREVKSLSKLDIEELTNGRGWGLAKAAELNGVPGPIHLLELKDEISLSTEQTAMIEEIYQEIKQEAILLGTELIELERGLNNHFANRSITDELLQKYLQEISEVHYKLRYVHLAAHLKTPNILSSEQITLYNKLRGYTSNDPCENIPEGHNPEMWKLHNDC